MILTNENDNNNNIHVNIIGGDGHHRPKCHTVSIFFVIIIDFDKMPAS